MLKIEMHLKPEIPNAINVSGMDLANSFRANGAACEMDEIPLSFLTADRKLVFACSESVHGRVIGPFTEFLVKQGAVIESIKCSELRDEDWKDNAVLMFTAISKQIWESRKTCAQVQDDVHKMSTLIAVMHALKRLADCNNSVKSFLVMAKKTEQWIHHGEAEISEACELVERSGCNADFSVDTSFTDELNASSKYDVMGLEYGLHLAFIFAFGNKGNLYEAICFVESKQ